MGTIPASENVFPLVRMAEVAAPSTPPTGEAHLYVKSDGLLYWKDDAGAEHGIDLAAHLADTSDAHDASAISITDAGTLYAATDVEAALAEVMGAVGGAGAVATDVIWDAAGDLALGSGSNTAARLAIGATGFMLESNGTTAAWIRQRVKIATPIVRTGGSHTVNGTTWTELAAVTGGAGTGAYDLNFTGCSAGDIVEFAANVGWGSEAIVGQLTAATIVSSSVVNYLVGAPTSSTGDGILGLYGPASAFVGQCGVAQYVLQSGDLSAGALKVRPMVRTASAGNKTLYGTTGDTAMFMGKVYRP